MKELNVESRTRPTDNEMESFRLWLQSKFTEKCKKNSRYSLRSFAKTLNIEASSLSQILNGKRKLSRASMNKICQRLPVKQRELVHFGLMVAPNAQDSFFQMNLDAFAVISDWYHYAILDLTYIDGFKSEPKWIALQLSIGVEEVKIAIERLKRLNLLIEENGSLIKTSRHMTNLSSIDTSSAHRELQRQVIGKALDAVDQCHPQEKDITSMTMAIDERNMDQARALIRTFRRDLCDLLEDGKQTRVYNLGIQLYPISNNGDSK